MKNIHAKAIALAIGDAGELPTEFRLFVAGWNATEHGSFLFDDVAAASVMDAYSKWGVDLAIDLEHQMLSDASVDPTARDARGWCKLALRNGELWAVDVRWTPDGAERLSQKRQRYISPAFAVDLETKRVSKMLNVALVAMPATHHTPALVAASLGACMDPDLVKSALDALVAGDSEKCMELLKGAIAAAASSEETAEAPPADAPPADAEMSAEAPPPAPAKPAADGAASTEDKKKEDVAASARVLRLTGATTLASAFEMLATYRESHLALEKDRQALAAERATLESAERRKLCVELVTLGGRAPATVWADSKPNAAPKAYLSAMPIDDLRAMHADAVKANAGKAAPKAPTKVEEHGLSERELAKCKKLGIKPEDYIAVKAAMIGKA